MENILVCSTVLKVVTDPCFQPATQVSALHSPPGTRLAPPDVTLAAALEGARQFCALKMLMISTNRVVRDEFCWPVDLSLQQPAAAHGEDAADIAAPRLTDGAKRHSRWRSKLKSKYIGR